MDSPKKKTTAYLTQIYGENTKRKFKLACEKVTIGRKLQAEIRLQNPNISRNHCTLSHTENGWTIIDNKSQNGTYVSGRKLIPGETRLLQCGDIIFLGPPSEMPEAFCYDNAFVDDEDIPESGHEIIELLPMKRPADEKVTASKKLNFLKESTKVESNKVASASIYNKSIHGTANVSKPKEMSDATNYSDDLIHTNKMFPSIINSESPSKLNRCDNENKTSCFVPSVKMSSSSIGSPPSKQSKMDNFDSGYQINEISSTADDKSDDSLSLLDVDKNEVPEPTTSSSMEVSTCVQKSEPSNETDLLKGKLALLSEQIRNLEKSKLDLLKNYEVVCEKNFALDQQLAEKKKLEENLKSKEDNLKSGLIEQLEEDLICNICTELLIKPTVLDCSHTFCQYCIKEWKKKKNECPMCRRKIQNMTSVLTLEHFIDKTLATFTPEQKERRNQLIKDRENPPKKAVTPTSKRRYGHGRRRFRRRSLSTMNRHLIASPASDDIQIIAERARSSVLPLPLETLAPLRMPNVFIRLPELLDNARDSINFYLT